MPKIKDTRRKTMARAGYASIADVASAVDVNRVTVYRWARVKKVRYKMEAGCIWVHLGDADKQARRV